MSSDRGPTEDNLESAKRRFNPRLMAGNSSSRASPCCFASPWVADLFELTTEEMRNPRPESVKSERKFVRQVVIHSASVPLIKRQEG